MILAKHLIETHLGFIIKIRSQLFYAAVKTPFFKFLKIFLKKKFY